MSSFWPLWLCKIEKNGFCQQRMSGPVEIFIIFRHFLISYSKFRHSTMPSYPSHQIHMRITFPRNSKHMPWIEEIHNINHNGHSWSSVFSVFDPVMPIVCFQLFLPICLPWKYAHPRSPCRSAHSRSYHAYMPTLEVTLTIGIMRL